MLRKDGGGKRERRPLFATVSQRLGRGRNASSFSRHHAGYISPPDKLATKKWEKQMVLFGRTADFLRVVDRWANRKKCSEEKLRLK